MPDFQLTTPVAFIIFNRPDTTERVFAEIARAKPPKLLVVGDGARVNRPGEAEKVAAARAIIQRVDWDCEVLTNFSEVNLGCKRRVSSGIDWVFEQVEEAIILEDDCLPHPDFFRFCDELLEKYKNDSRVWVVTGDNFQNGLKRGDASYYFSRYNHVWGWATWRRAWQRYDGDLSFWPEWKRTEDWVAKQPDKIERKYWGKIFDRMHAGEIDTWDYAWTATVWYYGGLTATPNVNLVSNIGFGVESTHTASADSPLANMPTGNLGRLSHPFELTQNVEADRYVFDHSFGGRNMRFPWSLLNLPQRAAGYVYRKRKGSFARWR